MLKIFIRVKYHIQNESGDRRKTPTVSPARQK